MNDEGAAAISQNELLCFVCDIHQELNKVQNRSKMSFCK